MSNFINFRYDYNSEILNRTIDPSLMNSGIINPSGVGIAQSTIISDYMGKDDAEYDDLTNEMKSMKQSQLGQSTISEEYKVQDYKQQESEKKMNFHDSATQKEKKKTFDNKDLFAGLNKNFQVIKQNEKYAPTQNMSMSTAMAAQQPLGNAPANSVGISSMVRDKMSNAFNLFGRGKEISQDDAQNAKENTNQPKSQVRHHRDIF